LSANNLTYLGLLLAVVAVSGRGMTVVG